MFNPLSYLLPRPRSVPIQTEEIDRLQEEVSAELKEKLTELHKSAREFEATAKEFLEDRDRFEALRHGKY